MTIFGIVVFCVITGAIYGLCILVERATRRASHFFTHGIRRWFLLGAAIASLILTPLLFRSCGSDNPTVANEKSGSVTISYPSTPSTPAERSQYFKLKKGESHTIRIWPGWQAWAVGGAIKIARPHGKERTLFPDSRISLGPQFDPEDITFTGMESTTAGFNLSGRW